MAYSKILGKFYDPSNNNVLYLTNLQQVYKMLNADERVSELLVDILYTNTKKDCLVFVFKKDPIMNELYEKWNQHLL